MYMLCYPFAGRLLTDSLYYPLRWREGFSTWIVIVVSHIMVLQVVDSDSSVLPIAGRPATIK